MQPHSGDLVNPRSNHYLRVQAVADLAFGVVAAVE